MNAGSFSSNVQVQYQNESAALAAKIYGLKPRPEIELSVNVGSKYTFAGGTATLDTRSRGLGGSKLGMLPTYLKYKGALNFSRNVF